MKLRIEVDSKDSPILKTTDTKVFIDDKQVEWLSGITFSADVNNPFPTLVLEGIRDNTKMNFIQRVINTFKKYKKILGKEIRERGY